MNIEDAPDTDYLGFIRAIDGHDKQRDYINLIFRIIRVELENQDNEKQGWRASWPFPPSHHQRPWIPAKTGYLNKLENEGLIQRDELSNSTTIYTLSVDIDGLIAEMGEHTELLDEENPLRDLEF